MVVNRIRAIKCGELQMLWLVAAGDKLVEKGGLQDGDNEAVERDGPSDGTSDEWPRIDEYREAESIRRRRERGRSRRDGESSSRFVESFSGVADVRFWRSW